MSMGTTSSSQIGRRAPAAVERFEPRLLLANVPAGFSDELVAGSLIQPVAMDFAPDGRIFVTEKAGRVRIIKDGQLLATPFVTLSVSSSGERGALGVTLDPNFAQNGFVYVYHTATTPNVHNRVSRFTASGDVAQPDSEVVLLDLEPLSATNHNGGAIHFGLDGKLYVAQGDNANGAFSQTLENRLGKVLRINSDGSIPSDNPFFDAATGVNRSIWALGLRNPFTFAFHRTSGRMFINDVGSTFFEEINEGAAGANYGWPQQEGPASSNPAFTPPVFFYHRNEAVQPAGRSINGGTFYDPPVKTFPQQYADDYFFADLTGRWIWSLDSATGAATEFATDLGPAVDLKAGPDGSLYYVAYSDGEIRKISFSDAAPAPQTQITAHPASTTVVAGNPATFTVQATGENLTYQWQRNNANIAGATAAAYTLSTTSPADNGAQFRVIVSGAGGTVTSNPATLTVTTTPATPPTIVTQPASVSVTAGQPATFSVSAQGEQLTYQWFRDDIAIPGATSASLTLDSTVAANNGAQFRVQVTGAGGASVVSEPATLSVSQVGAAPTAIVTQPASVTVRLGETATFSVQAGGDELTYQWQRNGIDIPGANATSYTLDAPSSVDHGSVFRVIVSGAGGTVVSEPATLVVDQNTAPIATITSPAEGRLYRAGQSIRFKGTGTDAEDGKLARSAYTWRVEFIDGSQVTTVMDASAGIRSGAYRTPRDANTSPTGIYRVHFTVTDSAGSTHTTSRDVHPRTVTITVNPSHPGLQFRLDQQPMTAPVSFEAVSGARHAFAADAVQVVDAVSYSFQKWSRGRRLEFDFVVPARDRTLALVYEAPE